MQQNSASGGFELRDKQGAGKMESSFSHTTLTDMTQSWLKIGRVSLYDLLTDYPKMLANHIDHRLYYFLVVSN